MIVAVLAYFAQSLARFIPYHYETQIADQYRAMYPPRTEVTEYLQQLVDHLAIAQELPADMRLTVHYVDKDTINAFATVGGHIVVFRGLLEKMPNENALAMVLAHEIAHVKHRHPIQVLGRGVVVGLALSIVTGATGNQSLGSVLGERKKRTSPRSLPSTVTTGTWLARTRFSRSWNSCPSAPAKRTFRHSSAPTRSAINASNACTPSRRRMAGGGSLA
ncbi:MAG: hypothetical protein AMJ84_13975 [Acidithiobacillales bacterium SM23_46]|nr:MAG: hypothetical protein AMJ84_13975 [Acidithiobacillales bacterium SM23_46]